jgi:hypothetical protein
MAKMILDPTTYAGLSVAHYVAYRNLTDDEYASVKGINPSVLAKASGVMSRLSFVDELRYIYKFDESDLIQCIHLDALEVYLLCTCLDTLAGKENYYDVQNWLKARKTKPAIHGSIEKNDHLTKVESLGERFSAALFQSVTSEILNIYNKNYGINQNIRQLILDLPESLKRFFADQYIIYQYGDESGKEKWENKSVDVKLKNIFIDYIFKFRRNKFTHESTGFRNFGGICSSRKELGKGNFDVPSSDSETFETSDDTMYIECKYGDEALFLREVITACLANSLGVMDLEWDRLYRNAEKKKRMLYALISEIKYNIQVMQGYYGVLTESLMISGEGAPKFVSKVAEAVAMKSGNESLPIYKNIFDEYISAISQFNNEVDSVSAGRDGFVNRSEEVLELIETANVRNSGLALWRFCGELLNEYPGWTSGYQRRANA